MNILVTEKTGGTVEAKIIILQNPVAEMPFLTKKPPTVFGRVPKKKFEEEHHDIRRIYRIAPR